MTRFLFIPSLATLIVAFCFAAIAHADTCLSSGVTVDANNAVTGVCTPQAANTSQPVSSTPGNGGIFSCNAPAGGSIGSRAAIGGTYVPVFDSAVALNTQILDYEECILRPLFNQQKQAATVAIASNNYKQISTGRDGKPYWPVDYQGDQLKVSDQATVQTVQGGAYKTINPLYQNPVQTAVLRNYMYTTRSPQNDLTCPYQDLQNALNGQTNDVFGALDAFVAYPGCNSYQVTVLAQNMLNNNIAAAQDQWRTQLNWGNGIYSATNNGQLNGNVTVPGIFMNAVGTQSLTSGFRQLENANDIGQMVGSFFSGIGSTLLSGPTSVAAVQQAYGNAVQQQQGSLIQSVLQAAVTNLSQILGWEQQYNNAQEQMASTIVNAISQLRAGERTCWNLIIQNVCDTSASSTSAGTCVAKSGGATLTIATSTAFSSAIISSSNFATLAQTLAQRIDISNQNLATIGTLIANVQSTDPATRNTALQQLDAITNANPPVLHTQTNITQAQDELTQLQAAISDTQSGVVATTIHRWAGDDTQGNTGVVAWNGDPSSDAGWCNVNKPQTLSNWTTAWTH